jgi:hypothetical protein
MLELRTLGWGKYVVTINSGMSPLAGSFVELGTNTIKSGKFRGDRRPRNCHDSQALEDAAFSSRSPSSDDDASDASDGHTP